MAEKEQVKKSPEGMVSIYNRGGRTFIIKVSGKKLKLDPEKSLLVPESMAPGLLKYKELIETGKMSARDSRTVAQLKKENEDLTAQLEKAKAGKVEKAEKDEKPAKGSEK
jgi:hypothetical protein